jgi:hypothetical protein
VYRAVERVGDAAGAESLQRDLEPVRPGREIRHGVTPAPVSHGGPADAGVDFRGDDRNARQDGPALVANRAAKFRGGLGPGHRCEKRCGEEKKSERRCEGTTTGAALHDVLLEIEARTNL